MTSGEYRQKPLESFDTFEALRDYLVPSDMEGATDPKSPYSMDPENFLDAIESIGSVDFRDLIYSHGLLSDIKDLNDQGSRTSLIIAANRSQEEQSRSLALTMAQIDRRSGDPETNAPIKHYVEMSIKEIEDLLPSKLSYRDKANLAENIERKIILDASKRFYDSHPSLARLALSNLQDRHEADPQ